MTLRPGETFTIVRQLGNPYDTGTYYVRAVVRNSATGNTLQTINLTDQGSQRFTGSYTVPFDGSGLGFYIDITTTAYDDSGYTTKSANYAETQNTYRIDERQWLGGIGGGGNDLDYKRVRKIIEEEVGKAIATINDHEPERIDIDPILLEIQNVKREVRAIDIPSQKEIDTESLILKLTSAVVGGIKKILPHTPDMSPLLKSIQNLDIERNIKVSVEPVKVNLEEITPQIEKIVKRSIQEHVEEKRRETEDLNRRAQSVPWYRKPLSREEINRAYASR